ncbi:sulfite exporter TauE/SafE family protein [Actinoallomurus soli]|uniref:sulfite exporter TauE/SafE family protein n=1 Tax=Actinoallomurus soli TaxID=2952535 RepID=UPI002093FAC6|nr:sulfite exporter TauE/SafE family protein [Actinoallomurus soli]MCO5973515.1 sulfite exporter TauE/SafE family protein [Actinoallomurus soli]
MELVVLLGIGLMTGVTTVLFGFGGGFVTVPVVVWSDAALGSGAMRVATATSALVMVVNAGFATAATRRNLLAALRGRAILLTLLAAGGAAGALLTRLVPPGLTRWAFVGYLVATIVDLLVRPGFIRPHAPGEAVPRGPRPIPAALGAPIGAVAAFLGVGGSVMTVPMLRRAGHSMHAATALANPLTLVIAVPAALVSLPAGPAPGAHLIGLIDPTAAACLLTGAIPVIIAFRRRPPRIPDHLYARSYLGLLVLVTITMLAAA